MPIRQLRLTVTPARVRRRRGVAERLAVAGCHRGIALGQVAAIALTDGLVDWHRMGFLPRGLVDEPCHLATAVIVVGTLTRCRGRAPDPRFVRAMLSASVLIDLDHVPLALGSSAWSGDLPRPYTHALWVVVLLAGIAAVSGRLPAARRAATAPPIVASLSAGAAWGVGAHFLRDVTTAPIALWWPVAGTGVQVPYWWYLMALAVLAAVPRHRGRRPGT